MVLGVCSIAQPLELHGLRLRDQARAADALRGHPADRRGPFRRVRPHVLAQLEPVDRRLAVVELLVDEDVLQGERQPRRSRA
jgi:hypothetical protein